MVELAKQHGVCVEDADCALLSDGIALQCPSLQVSYGMCYLPVASAQVQAFHDDAQALQAHYCDLARDKGIRGEGGGPMCLGEREAVCREGVCDVGGVVPRR